MSSRFVSIGLIDVDMEEVKRLIDTYDKLLSTKKTNYEISHEKKEHEKAIDKAYQNFHEYSVKHAWENLEYLKLAVSDLENAKRQIKRLGAEIEALKLIYNINSSDST